MDPSAIIDGILGGSTSAPIRGRRATFYDMLNCVETSSKEQITTEFRRLALQLHPDKRLGGDSEKHAQDNIRFAEIQHAYEILTGEESRKKYDMWLRSGLRISYEDWESIGGAELSSTHFVGRGKPELLISDSGGANDGDLGGVAPPVTPATHAITGAAQQACHAADGRHVTDGRSSSRSKFRNYEI